MQKALKMGEFSRLANEQAYIVYALAAVVWFLALVGKAVAEKKNWGLVAMYFVLVVIYGALAVSQWP